MSTDNKHEIIGPQPEPGHHSLMEIFDELTFTEKWKKVFHGLKQPKDTGDYKYAKLQIQRLSAPAAAVAVPLLTILLLVSMGVTQATKREYEVQVLQPEELEQLDEETEKLIEEIEPPEPVQTEVPDEANISTEVVTENTAVGPPQDFSPQPAALDSVAITKSPVVLKGILGSRSPGARGAALAGHGGSGATERAVLLALRWLKKNQNPDGSWPNVKPAMTGLALLTYLAHGETPASEEFGQTVERAIKWLVENQAPSGRFNGSDGHEYALPIATYALCEAAAMTRIPMVKTAAEKAVTQLIQGQNPTGGWNYNCKPVDNRDDTSYMGWCAQAVKAAKLADIHPEGLDACLKKAIQGFKKNYGGRDGYGGFGYTGPAQSGLTGVGALCMQLLGQGKSQEVKDALNTLEATTFIWDENAAKGGKFNDNYYWYYITQAKFHEGGATWTAWNKLFSPVLVKNITVIPNAIEDAKGKLVDIGFWSMPKGISGHTDGDVMNTCLCALQLQVYYRYLPTYKTPEAVAEGPASLGDANKDIDVQIL